MVQGSLQPCSARADGFGQERFFDRRPALIDLPNVFRVNVNADHLKTARCQCGGNAGAQLAQAAD